MKILLVFFSLLFSTIFSIAQSGPVTESIDSSADSIIVNPDSVFTKVSVPAEFPGGMEKLYRFLARNVIYPKSALDKKIQGKVIVGFVVDKEGNVRDIQIEKGVYEALDQEAIRVLRLLPKFTPAKINGQNVNFKTTIPIIFSLGG